MTLGKMRFAVFRASLVYQTNFLDGVSGFRKLNIVSISCTGTLMEIKPDNFVYRPYLLYMYIYTYAI